MSRSKHARKPNASDKYYHGCWILESSRKQRRRLKQEVNRALKDPEHEVQLTLRGPKNAYDYP